jgi:uncharacterized membrane protein SpoIIM required for sporulation
MNMSPLEFERRYAPVWQKLEELVTWLEARKTPKTRKADDEWNADLIPPLYRETCHHLALARDRGYPSFLVSRLNLLVHRAHQALYRPKTRIWSQIWDFIAAGFPALVRANKWVMALSAVAFALPLVVLGVLIYFQPEFIYSVFEPDQVSSFERMYNPYGKSIGRERAADSDFMMLGVYIKNNIGISFQVFASGIVYGIGSLFYLVVNGIFIGATAGYLTQLGYGSTFWSFVCGHGAFELTAIVIAGGAGLKMGFSLLAPGRLTRLHALTVAAKEAVRIIYGAAGMLLIAAFIEAFWSSSRWISSDVKYGTAAFLWFAVAYYFVVMGRGRTRENTR